MEQVIREIELARIERTASDYGHAAPSPHPDLVMTGTLPGPTTP